MNQEIQFHLKKSMELLNQQSELQAKQIADLIELCRIQQEQINEQRNVIDSLSQFIQFLNHGVQNLSKMLGQY